MIELSFKHGKQSPGYDKRDLHFESYRAHFGVSLPKHPLSFGHEGQIYDWGVLGNDQWGDCVFAGAAHETMLWGSASHGLAPRFTPSVVLADYGAVTGFNPDKPETDRGTIVRSALNYRRRVGVVDALGKRHKIGAFLALEPGNWDHLLEALWLFGAVGVGIQFPASAMDQFNARKPWSVVSGSSIDGGHYIPLVAKRGQIVCVTWGRPQRMTKNFFERYCDEAWAMVSQEFLNEQGKSPEGFDLAQLNEDLDVIGRAA